MVNPIQRIGFFSYLCSRLENKNGKPKLKSREKSYPKRKL